jgi:uncharacterized membrane protein YraQ (UPF0718 family)
MEQLIKIAAFILNSFLHIWPYLLITIPLSVIVQLSGASKYIRKAFSKNPIIAIFLATAIGAVSPFCSCGVIPVITSLLIGGVPLAPVMSFWIASPSMDPEIFFLSVATVGWKMSVWRLAATFVISLSAGFITHFANKKGYFGSEILRPNLDLAKDKKQNNMFNILAANLKEFYTMIRNNGKRAVQVQTVKSSPFNHSTVACCITVNDPAIDTRVNYSSEGCNCSSEENTVGDSLFQKILKESWKAFSVIAKFMAIAFFINALIQFYLPTDLITRFVGSNNSFSVLVASAVGIPFYTSNLTALPVISGLLKLGMNQGAALSFLIAGPVTTLPAMMAVWGIVKPKVFLFYLSFSFLGALLFGYLYNFLN